MYEEVFEKEGFYVKVAMSGEEALQVARETKPDFILLDILLLEQSGIYFLEHKRKDPQIANIPVAAFSNFDDAHTKRQALLLGAQDYLIKTNYTPQEVVKEVQKYLK